MSVDRNAADSLRLRRNAQRTRAGDSTSSVKISAPLILSNGAITVNLSPTGGLQNASSQLGIKLATNPGLSLSASGLTVQLADSSLALGVSGLQVQLANTGSLELNTGLQVAGVKQLSADPGSPADGNAWYNTTGKGFKFRDAGVTARLVGIVFANTADSTGVSNTIALTNDSLSFTFPANFFTVGKTIVIRFSAYITTTGTPTLSLDFVCSSGTIDGASFVTINNSNGQRFGGELWLTCTATGNPGNIRWGGYVIGEIAAGAINMQPIGGPFGGSFSFNTTIAQQFNMAYQWSVASASNTIKTRIFQVEVKDPA